MDLKMFGLYLGYLLLRSATQIQGIPHPLESGRDAHMNGALTATLDPHAPFPLGLQITYDSHTGRPGAKILHAMFEAMASMWFKPTATVFSESLFLPDPEFKGGMFVIIERASSIRVDQLMRATYESMVKILDAQGSVLTVGVPSCIISSVGQTQHRIARLSPVLDNPAAASSAMSVKSNNAVTANGSLATTTVSETVRTWIIESVGAPIRQTLMTKLLLAATTILLWHFEPHESLDSEYAPMSGHGQTRIFQSDDENVQLTIDFNSLKCGNIKATMSDMFDLLHGLLLEDEILMHPRAFGGYALCATKGTETAEKAMFRLSFEEKRKKVEQGIEVFTVDTAASSGEGQSYRLDITQDQENETATA